MEVRRTSHYLTRRFPQTLGGFSPPAVRAVIAELNAYYQGQEISLSAHLRDLVQLVDWLKLAAEAVEGVLTIVAPAVPSGPAEGEQTAATWHPVMPSPPATKSMRRALIGYRRRAVQAALAVLCERWETELGVRIAEAVKLEAQRLAYMGRLSRARQYLKEAQLKPLAPAARIHSIDNVVPLKSREVKVTLQVQAGAAPAGSGVKLLHAWRPGSV